jgi:DNA-binding SARP family transcriptional activator
MSRARPAAAGLLAVAALAGIVVGLPIVLYRFGGSPLPRHVPSWHRLLIALGSRDDGALFVTAVRDCSWLAWLLFTASVAAEAQAAVRGRRAPRLRLGGLQGAAAHLVALAAVTFAAPAAVTLAVAAPAIAAVGHGPAQHSPGPAGTRTSTRMITVRAGDCLWAIAQHYLGAGDRYPEIARLNYGRDVGDGQTFSNPALIEPGWHLLLPADSTRGPMGASTYRAHHLGHSTRDAHYRRHHAGAALRPEGRPAGGHGNSPDGATQSADGDARPERGDARAADDEVRTPGRGSRQTSGDGESGRGDQQSAGEEIGLFVAGALAGSVLTSLARLRSRQRQYRRRGRRIRLPADSGVLAVEQKLRAAAPAEPPGTLREALACLQAGIIASGQALPDILGLHVTPDALEVLLSAPAADSPPPPFSITPGRQGMCWQLDLPPSAGEAVASCDLLSGLFTAGATAEGYLLLDLEALKVTGCSGPADLVDRVTTSAATELATGRWSGWYELILVGFSELAAVGCGEHCDGLDQALDMLERRTDGIRRRLEGQPLADVRELRLSAPDDEDWGLTILVSRAPPTAEQMTRLIELAEDGPGGIGALVAGDRETPDGRMASTVLQLGPDPGQPDGIVANVVPLQVAVRPRVLSAPDYESIGTLFAVAAEDEDCSPQDAPYAMYSAPPWIPEASGSPPEGDELEPADAGTAGEDPADDADESDSVGVSVTPAPPRHAAGSGTRPPLRVGVLGPLVVDGTVEQLQPKQAELLLALALAAPAGLSNSALCGMLGADPDHAKPSDTVRQTITRTRRHLGRAADGREYIIHAGNGVYLLHEDASLDWTTFRELVASGRAEDLRAALSLVRGQPFADCYYWWIDIPLLETVRAEVVDAAETLAEFELATGSARAAARAARAGLTAERSAEQLWRLLMRAEHGAGNLAGVTEVWKHCLDAIEEIAPGGEPHPDTAALYRRLTTASGLSLRS